jgi:hypothetical protein
VPLKRLKFRCAQCGSSRADHVVMSWDALRVQPKFQRFVRQGKRKPLREKPPPTFGIAGERRACPDCVQSKPGRKNMTQRTWIGGHDGNDAGSAANWSPSGAPQRGDNLAVATGTLEISNTNLAGNVLHLQNATVGGGPVVLDLNGNARISVDGSRTYGDDPTVNVTGNDSLDATGGLHGIFGTINLSDHAHLVVTGQMSFAGYAMGINGGAHSILTNNGIIETADGNISAALNGHGTLSLSGYHDGTGFSQISAPIGGGQTVQLSSGFFGMQLTLNDPADFHALLKVMPPLPSPSDGDVWVVLPGVVATDFKVQGDELTLKNGNRTVDTLRVDNTAHVPVTAAFAPDATTLVFHTAHA